VEFAAAGSMWHCFGSPMNRGEPVQSLPGRSFYGSRGLGEVWQVSVAMTRLMIRRLARARWFLDSLFY
jgi:hypothetical protein